MSQITTMVSLPCTITEAHAQLTHADVACIVNPHGVPLGLTDARTVARAYAYGLGDASIRQCMWDLPTYRRSVYTPTVQLMRTKQGYCAEHISETPAHMISWEQVQQSLPPTLADVLNQLAMVAAQFGVQLYVVGGAVRSVLHATPITDLDVAIHGDMVELGQAMAQQLATPIMQRSAFDTATLAMPQAVADATGIPYLDLVPLRIEQYQHPGALPSVHPTASIVVDLGRRDLTINAMAIAYRLHTPMPLYDPFAGQVDLHKRHARLLHPLSIIDDPTRAIRLARLMVRMQLTPDAMTLRAIRWAVETEAIRRVSRQRWIQEVLRVLDEPDPAAIMRLLRRWRILPQIDEALMHGVAPEVHQLPTAWRIVALLWCAPVGQLIRFMYVWHDAPKPLRGIGALRQTKRRWRTLMTRPPSYTAQYVRQFDRALLDAVAIIEADLAVLLQRVDAAYAVMPTLLVRGSDVIGLGISPGPMVGQLLQALSDALLDGTVHLVTYDAQIEWVRRLASAHTASPQIDRKTV